MFMRQFNAENLLKFIKGNKAGFERVLDKIKIIALGDGKCTVEMKIDETHTNPMGGLHGGLSATLIDSISTYALTSKLGYEIPHVSVDIHITYMKGAKVNDEIVVDANVVKYGKSVAFLDVEIKNKATGDLLIKGSHTKFIKSGIKMKPSNFISDA